MPGPDHPRPARTGWPARLLAAVTAGYACLLVWATHYPKPQDLLGPDPPSDKLLHVGAYAIFAALVAATLLAMGRLSTRGTRTAAAALAAFAVVDEVTQPLPWFGRSADPVDWIFDVAGIAIGMAGIAALAFALRRRPTGGTGQ